MDVEVPEAAHDTSHIHQDHSMIQVLFRGTDSLPQVSWRCSSCLVLLSRCVSEVCLQQCEIPHNLNSSDHIFFSLRFSCLFGSLTLQIRHCPAQADSLFFNLFLGIDKKGGTKGTISLEKLLTE